MRLAAEEMELAELVRNVLDVCGSLVKEKGHTLAVRADVAHERVRGDFGRLQQLFTNLLANAAKYTPAGGSISFSIDELPSLYTDVGLFECVIEDNGIGMSEDFVKHLFEPFKRADDQFLLKGVLSVEDALAAEECGCDAIVVSNHGGRAFEAVPGTAAALPAIAQSVRRMTVLVDGGVRAGADVLKMLALGAAAVLIGRPAIIAAMGGEEEGVRMLLTRMQRQLEESMLLTGCASVREAGPHLLA